MDEETSPWLSGGQPSSSPTSSATPAHMPSLTTYNPTALKTIGQKCSQHLPPANAIQAMFIYEMQRQTEDEELFKNQMFRLARNEDASTMQERCIKELENKLVRLEKAMTNKEVEERLATSKSTMQMLGEKVNGCLKKVEGLEAVMVEVKSRIESFEKGLKEKKTEVVNEEAPESKAAFAKMMKAEIDVLFEDRDGMLAMINEIKQHLASLETSSTGKHTTTGNASSHSPYLNCAAPLPVTDTMNGVGLTGGTNYQPDQTDPTATGKKEGRDNGDVEKLLEHGNVFAKLERTMRREEQEAARSKEAEGAALISSAKTINSSAAYHLRSEQSHPRTIPTMAVTNSPGPQTQRLPVQTTSSSSATPLELSIPKGKAHVGFRASVHAAPPVPAPSNLRPFTPGKSWAS